LKEISVPKQKDRPGLARIVRALAHPNFRLFFFGQTVSLIGTWMQQLGMLWLVGRLYDSSALLGITGFCEQIPTLLLAPVAGVLTDRWNRHRVLVVTQSLLMLQAFLLTALVLSGQVRLWHLLVLSTFLGLVQSFDITTRQAFLSEMVPRKEDLANAIALNSSIVNGARLIGPALAGLVTYWLGEGVCFLINGLSYLAVLASLLRMTIPPAAARAHVSRFWHGFREGLLFTARTRPIRNILLLMAAVSFLGMPYTVLMPVIVLRYLGGGARLLGLLMAASGLGALTAAIYLAGRPSVLGLSGRLAVAPCAFGAGLVAFALCTLAEQTALLFLVLPIMGFAIMLQMAAGSSIVQTIVPEDKRGRVMSFLVMSFMGTVPVGSLVMGNIAEHLGAPQTLLAGGIGCVAAAGLFFLDFGRFRRDLKEIYIRLNIWPRPQPEAGLASTRNDTALAMSLALNETNVMPGECGASGAGLEAPANGPHAAPAAEDEQR
jgi:MFS family permease